jgi:hypothetical protein
MKKDLLLKAVTITEFKRRHSQMPNLLLGVGNVRLKTKRRWQNEVEDLCRFVSFNVTFASLVSVPLNGGARFMMNGLMTAGSRCFGVET